MNRNKNTRTRGIFFLLSGILLVTALTPTQAWTAAASRVTVVPVIFLTTDAVRGVTDAELVRYGALLQQHLSIGQKKYRALLETDTFAVEEKVLTVYGARESAYYDNIPKRDDADGVDVITAEIFRAARDNRTDSHAIYLTLFVREGYAAPAPGNHQFGGGRTFNGPPGSGGGVIVLEMSSLLRDRPYPIQSTLVHELGHAFGLTHPNCFGYDINTNNSLMSYNPRHHTKGFEPAPLSGTFNPEEFYELSLNKRVFPHFSYNPARHNPRGVDISDVDRCFLGPMQSVIGDYRRVPGRGYELFFDGKLVSGPEAAYYTGDQARKNCRVNRERYTGDGTRVECRYNGKPF